MRQGSLPQKLLRKLDEIHFLNFRLWEFSINSLSRFYGIFFLSRVVFPHPLQTARALYRYQKFLQRNLIVNDDIVCVFWSREEGLLRKMKEQGQQTLIGVGYCQKPLHVASQSCPAGRANHLCTYFEGSNALPSAVCKACGIRIIGEAALRAGIGLYIMTSALDIARDIFLPTLKHQKYSYVVLFLCPYSVRAIILPLLICGLEGFLVPYSGGDCRDYGQFLQADRGLKSEQTHLAEETFKKALKIIGALAPDTDDRYGGFRRHGNIYVPITHSFLRKTSEDY